MKRQLLSGFSMVLSYSAFVCWLFAFSHIQNECEYLAISPLLLALFYYLVYLLDLWMSRKTVSLALYVGTQLFLALCSIFVFLGISTMIPFHRGTMIFLGIFLAGGVFACGYAASDPIQPKNLIFYFDSVIVLMILLLLLQHLHPLFMVKEVLLLCFLAMVMDMLSLILFRTEGSAITGQKQSAARAGRWAVGGILALILLVAGLFIAFAASGTRSLSMALLQAAKWLWGILRSLGEFLFDLLERLVRWLVQFLPATTAEPMEAESIPTMEGSAVSGSAAVIPHWIYYIAGAILAIFLIRFLLSMVREKAGSEQADSPATVATRRSGTLSSGLRQMFRDIKSYLVYCKTRLTYRNTAPGLLLLCQRRASGAKKRHAGESGPAFLIRLSAEMTSEPHRLALEELSRLLEQTFYSSTVPPVPKQLSKAIRSCKF